MIPVRNSIGGLGNLMFKQAYLYAQARAGVIPDTYVQSKKYWEPYQEEIRILFGQDLGYIDKVSLQIRRGDYITHYSSFYEDIVAQGYYQEAVALFPTEKFLVFCHDGQDPKQDDLDKEWCKTFLDTFIAGRYEMNEPGTETDDLNKMASCKSNIIANSSFGWWSAFLNPNPDKKVTVPAKWFKDGLQRCDLLDEWIKI